MTREEAFDPRAGAGIVWNSFREARLSEPIGLRADIAALTLRAITRRKELLNHLVGEGEQGWRQVEP